MKVLRHALTALLALIVFTVLLGIIYPLAMTGIARIMPHQADGSLIMVDGKPVGSALLGQPPASDPRWFQPRPSASDYSGDVSGGSNKGGTQEDLLKAVEERRAALLAANPDAKGEIPPDALSASSSGLDPHISPEYATWQTPRVVAATGLSEADIKALIDQNTIQPLWGLIGPKVVNVTTLNVDLAKKLGS